MLHRIQKEFDLSRSQAKGFVVMLFTIVVFLTAPFFYDWLVPSKPVESSISSAKMDSMLAFIEVAYAQPSLEVSSGINHGDNTPIEEEQESILPASTTKPASRNSYSHHKKTSKPKPVSFELNSADTAQLQSIYGIGPAFSKRIIKFRDLLGGFVAKDQLYQVYKLDSVVANRLMKRCTLDASLVKKLDVNNATVKQLVHHPYLDYETAVQIVRQRERKGLYRDWENLNQRVVLGEKKKWLKGYFSGYR